MSISRIESNYFASQRQKIRNNNHSFNPLSSRLYADRIVSEAKKDTFINLGLNKRPLEEKILDGYYGTFATLTLGYYRDVVQRVAFKAENHLPLISVSLKRVVHNFLPQHKNTLNASVQNILKFPPKLRNRIDKLNVSKVIKDAVVYAADGAHGMSRRRATVEAGLVAVDTLNLPMIITDPINTHKAFEIHSEVIADSVLKMAYDSLTNPNSPMRKNKKLFAQVVTNLIGTDLLKSSLYKDLLDEFTKLTINEQNAQDKLDNFNRNHSFLKRRINRWGFMLKSKYNTEHNLLLSQKDQLTHQKDTLGTLLVVIQESEKLNKSSP